MPLVQVRHSNECIAQRVACTTCSIGQSMNGFRAMSQQRNTMHTKGGIAMAMTVSDDKNCLHAMWRSGQRSVERCHMPLDEPTTLHMVASQRPADHIRVAWRWRPNVRGEQQPRGDPREVCPLRFVQ